MAKTGRLSIFLSALLITTSVALTAPPAFQGPTFLPGDAGHDAATGDQEHAAIAAGGGGSLAAWTDIRTSFGDGFGNGGSGRDIYVARLDASGNLLDAAPMILSQAAGSQQQPELAWNGSSWLVVWENQTPSGTGGSAPKKIFGARVAADGTVLDSPFEILEAAGFAGSILQISVAANGPEWLVVGQADSGGGLLGVRVASDGSVLDPVPVILVAPLWFLYSDVELHVAQGEYLLSYDGQASFEARRFAPDLTQIGRTIFLPAHEVRLASSGNDYYITWDPPGLELLGSRMAVDGTLASPGGVPIMDSAWDTSTQTAVAWDGSNWWVAHEQPNVGGGLKLARVGTDGQVLDTPPLPVFDPADEEFVGTWRLTGGVAGGVQVVWADQDCSCEDEWSTALDPWDIHGLHVSATGQVAAETPLSCGAPAQVSPDLAAGPAQFLAVFHSESADVRRILAQRLDSQGNAIDTEPIEIATGSWLTNPAVAWNGSVYMIVWDEFYYCVGGDPGPCGSFIQAVRMLPDGTLLDAQPITIMKGNHADVAALGENFLVVGRDNFIFLHHEVVPLGVRVSGAGAVLDPVPLLLGWSFAVHPRVTAYGDRWLVVFERRVSHDENWGGSYFNFVAADGTVRYDKFETRGACGGAEPDVAVSGAGALVVCREGAPGHFLNDINGGLIFPDETASLFEISGAVEEQSAPAVVWTGTEFLVAWEDERNGIDYFDERTDLYGARIDMFGTVLDPDGFVIAGGATPEQQPTFAYGGADVLMAASIFRDAAPDTNYRLGIYHTPGTANDPPQVAFSQSATGGCSPLDVSFTDQSVGSVSSWMWSFGDGNYSSQQNPTHVYAEPGTYTVFLTAVGDSGPASHVEFDLVEVAQGTVADFWAAETMGCAPFDVTFYNTSLGDQTDWTWMFGDDKVSTAQVPTHTYQYPGLYTVMLTANGACGGDTETRVEYIRIDEMCPVQDEAVADFPVDGVVSGTYADTHVDGVAQTMQLIEEVPVAVEGGMTWQMEHRWQFEVPGGADSMEFYVHFYAYGNPQELFHFEYSQDNVNYSPLVTLSGPWSSEHHVPLPSNLQGTVWIRMYDSDRTTADIYRDYAGIYEMAIESGVPTPYHRVPATMGLEFADRDTLAWMPTAAATRYDVMWGQLSDLHTNGSVGDAQCGWEDSIGTTLFDNSGPPPGVGYYYLVRGDAEGLQAGTLDNVPGLTVPEGRDLDAGTAGGSACGDMP